MKETAYLVVHGFAGSPEEIEYLVAYLRAEGFDAHTVLLRGHGGTKRDLARSNHEDWIASVREAADALKKEYRRIVFLGFSMGGLICLHFADAPETDGLVLVNTPIYFWNLRIIAGDVLGAVLKGRPERWAYYKESVRGVSLKSGIDFLKILSASKRAMGTVGKPTLVAQCMDDESAHHKSARYIKEKLGPQARERYYDGGRHQVFGEPSEIRERLCEDICRFLREEGQA